MYSDNHHGDGRIALWCQPDHRRQTSGIRERRYSGVYAPPGAQEILVAADARHFFVPPYVGTEGWLGIHLDKGLDYMQNPLRQNLFRAGHAHAGVLLILSLVALRYVDETRLSEGARRFVRFAIPSSAILLPLAFFLSVLPPDATRPNGLIALAYVGASLLAAGLLLLGIGLLRNGSRAAYDAPGGRV